jgi:O-methyltransferase
MRKPHIVEHDPAKGAALREAMAEYSVGDDDPVRVVQLFHLIEAANQLKHGGDYGEFGTHIGLTLKVIHRFMDQHCMLYSFDTFAGFDERDVVAETSKASHLAAGGFHPTSQERVWRYLGEPANLHMIAGWFPETFDGFEQMRWRFAHIDFDLYDPTKAALDAIWPQLVPGGVVMVHDYGCYGFPGVRRAVDGFCSETGILPIELADRWGTAAFRKPA